MVMEAAMVAAELMNSLRLSISDLLISGVVADKNLAIITELSIHFLDGWQQGLAQHPSTLFPEKYIFSKIPKINPLL